MAEAKLAERPHHPARPQSEPEAGAALPGEPVTAAVAPPSPSAAPAPGPAPRVAAPAASAVAAAKPVRPPEPPKLEGRFFHQRDIKQNEWYVIPYRTHSLDDILKPGYWANVVRSLKVSDKIVLMREDCRLYAELIVFGCGSNWAEVQVLGTPIVLDHDINTADTDYKFDNRGLIKQWCVVRVSDDREIKTGLLTRDAAMGWLRDYLTMERRRPA
jgi:hypothetical protein